MSRPTLTRRSFLKWAGVAGAAVLVPSVAGGAALWRLADGEQPSTLSPYFTRPNITPSAVRPILILAAPNSFGHYLAELLAVEGLNAFALASPAEANADLLNRFSLVLLAQADLEPVQVESLSAYVRGGGRLVALRPAAPLAALCGVQRVSGESSEGYLALDPNHALSNAMVGERLQYHGLADHYRLDGAEAVAWLATRDSVGDLPAVTLHRNGAGQAALWAFDLAQSVALTRQGNPAWANVARASRDGNIRAQDMFKGWMDLDRIEIPQADEQLRLLSRLITGMLADVLPLPRLWYFPGAAEAMLIATGDSHQNPVSAIESVLARVEGFGGRMSVYYTPPTTDDLRRMSRRARGLATDLPLIGGALARPTDLPTPKHVAAWLARGHEFGLHPYVEEGLEAGWAKYWENFTGFGYGPVSPTVRTHRILWTGWVQTALTQAAHGMRLNVDYYQYGYAFEKDDGAWAYGQFTGSGLPARFVDEAGQVIALHQQVTQIVDEHLLPMEWGGGYPQLTVEGAIEAARGVLERARGEHGSAAVCAQFHIDPFAAGGEWAERFGRFMDATLQYAADNGIPVYSAAEWLAFIEARDAATLDELRWDADAQRLTFALNAPRAEGVSLAVLLPAHHNARALVECRVDGQRVASTGTRRVGGLEYVSIVIASDTHHCEVTYA
jgi:hypothetical protein